MKKILTLLFLSASFIASAQFCRKDTVTYYNGADRASKQPTTRNINYYKSATNNQLDSIYVQKYTNNAWGNSVRNTFEYTNENVSQQIKSEFIANIWELTKRRTWTYNADGKPLITSDADYLGGWKPTTEVANTYNTDNNLTEQVQKSFSIQRWIKYSFTYDDNKNTTQTLIQVSGNGGRNYEDNSRLRRSFNAASKITYEEESQLSGATYRLELVSKKELQYDVNNNNTNEEWFTMQAIGWVPNYLIRRQFNADNQVLREEYPIYRANAWVNGQRVIYNYTNKLLSKKQLQYFNGSNMIANDWGDYTVNHYFYNTNNKVVLDSGTGWNGTLRVQQPANRRMYTYADTGEWRQNLYQTYNASTGVFVNNTKLIKDFDARKNKTLDADYQWNTGLNNWTANSEKTFTYSTSNKLMQEVDKFWDGNALTFRSTRTYTYHPTYDFLTEIEFEQSYDASLGKYVQYDSEVYGCVNSVNNTGVLSKIKTEGLIIYPNPNNTGKLNIENAENVNVKIFNTVGQLVMEVTQIENNAIDISQLDKGLYIVVLQNGNVKQSSKLIVE